MTNRKFEEKWNKQQQMDKKKQAVEVNKHRKWIGGETIPKGTVCLLKLSQDKNSVGVKELPVVITSLHYYKQSGNIRYKVASKDGHITETYGREARAPLVPPLKAGRQ